MIWQDLHFISLEITLFLSGLVFLMVGAYRKADSFKLICTISIVILFVSLFAFPFFLERPRSAFFNMLDSSYFIDLLKVILILSAIAFLLLLRPLKVTENYLNYEFVILFLFSLVGMLFLISSNNLLMLYLSFELMSLPLYIMASYNRDNPFSTEAGIKYFSLGALSSCIYLLGASLVYGFTASGDFSVINDFYLTIAGGDTAESIVIPVGFLVGLILITVAICFKISAVPFHMWTPDVYQGSPTIVTIFFASLPKVAALGLFAKILYHGFVDLAEQWIQIILIVSVASMFVGSLAAIMQTNIKRMLAYSSIGNVGFILVGLVSGEEQGLKGFMIYLMIYLTMTMGIFAAILMLRPAGKAVEEIKQLAGLSKSHPYLAFAISVLLFSLAGIPPFAGFFAKFYILMAAIDQGAYYYAVSVVTASVIAAFYYIRIVKIIYMDEADQSIELSSPFSIKATLATSVTFNLLYVIMPAPIIIIAEKAATSIFR